VEIALARRLEVLRCSKVSAQLRDADFHAIRLRESAQGSAKHLEMLLDRGWGKPLQGIDLDARLDFTDTLTRIKERQRQLADATPAQMGSEMEKPNGHATRATVEQAEEISEAPVVPAERIKRVVV